MRGLRQELVSTATVLLVPAMLAVAFPYGAFTFKARPRLCEKKPFAAFVEMSVERQQEALRAAKASWQVGSAASGRWHADLGVGELPADRISPSLDLLPVPARSEWTVISYAPAAYPCGLAADEVSPMAAEKEEDRPRQAFSKEELLKLE